MYNKILSYLKEDIYPFHMPGHKGNSAFFPKEILKLDITEIPNMDVLSAPTGILREMQERIAHFYNSDKSYFLVNGSSAGVVAAICATCNENTTVIIPRNAHISVYNGLVLSGGKPFYIMPEITCNSLVGGICPSKFDNIPSNSVVLVVSPTYEGFVSDIATIAKKVHAHNGILIVDEAHGAHFPFHNSFPKSAISQGADIVINSLHKTLPAFSQCAVLHVKSNFVDYDKLHFFINAMQTSSPSYMFMASTDYMLQMLWQDSSFFNNYVDNLKELRLSLPIIENEKDTANIGIALDVPIIGKNAIYDIDISKLLFYVSNQKLDSAESISAILANEYKIQVEMARGKHILAMTSVADTNEGFNRLQLAIYKLNYSLSTSQRDKEDCNKKICTGDIFSPFLPTTILSPKEALHYKTKQLPWKEAVGHISGELITVYPPGISILAPGEQIPKELAPQAEFIRVIDNPTSKKPYLPNPKST